MEDVSVELEEVSLRRDYSLIAKFGCWKCWNEGEKMWYFTTIFLHEGIKQVCTKKHITQVHKVCTRCSINYPLKVNFCPPCEKRVEDIIRLEKKILDCEERIEETKRKARKKEIIQEYSEVLISTFVQQKYNFELDLEELVNAKP